MTDTQTRTYHRELGFPGVVRVPCGTYKPHYSEHARRAADADRHGYINLPDRLTFDTEDVVEIEVDTHRRVVKVVARVPYDQTNDLVVVLVPQDSNVKTVWLNNRSDKHKTLRRQKYAVPNRYERQRRW